MSETEVRDGSLSMKDNIHVLRKPISPDDDAVLGLRNVLYEMCNQHGGGHGGSAIGMAAIGVALWKYVMRYNPSNPDWFDRDRFVLSNGHAAMFLYALNYLVGYDNWTLDELRGYASPKEDGYSTISHGHPERQVPGIEVTTGPLGQGIASAVGLAVASKNMSARYNRPGLDVVQSRVYCMTGDGCLMEGVALEAISLAGNLGLDNLILIYDNNQVTCDGPLDWTNAEDVDSKFRASGWDVLTVADGNYDVKAIVTALEHGKTLRGKPVMINIRTTIGVGTKSAGTHLAHHGAVDAGSVDAARSLAGGHRSSTGIVSDQCLEFFRERKPHGEKLESEWNSLVHRHMNEYPDVGQEFLQRRRGDAPRIGGELLRDLDSSPFANMATRESNGAILKRLWQVEPALFGGGADLVNSCKFSYEAEDVFHRAVSYNGRFVRYGIREHAMAAISNGIAAFNPGTFLPVDATFFMFYLYAAPAVRMGALSDLPVIHIATHDSFAEGQNGPTHQPVELDSLYRAMPNLRYIRPADAEEVIGAWILALSNRRGPTMLSLGRDPCKEPISGTDRHKVARGAYVIQDVENPKLVIVSCGTNLHYAIAAAAKMTAFGYPTRVVSAPSLSHFDDQDADYRQSIFPLDGTPIVSVEEYVATTLARYTTASIGMSSFGYSASNASNYQRFGLDSAGIVRRLKAYLKVLDNGNARNAGWQAI